MIVISRLASFFSFLYIYFLFLLWVVPYNGSTIAEENDVSSPKYTLSKY